MTSAVDTSVKYFSNSMSGAPALNGATGSLIALLDATLVTGFDIKALASLSIAGGIATMTWSGAHSCDEDTVVLVSGVTGGPAGFADLNGEQKIVAKLSGSSATFSTSVADGSATGTITMKMAPAGWSKAFVGTNLAVYKSSDLMASGCCLRVDDTTTLFARVVGYESMSDVASGVGPFPTPGQISGGGYWPKSTLTTGAVDWYVFADSRIFYFAPVPGRSQSASFLCGTLRGFGDIVAYKPSGDSFGCVLPFSTNPTVTSQFDGSLSTGPTAQIAMPRAFTGIGSAVLHYSIPFGGGTTGLSGITASYGPFPNPVDGTLSMGRRVVMPAGQAYARGELPGYMHVLQSGFYDMFKPGDSVPGTGPFSGRKFIAFTVGSDLAFITGASSTTVALGLMDVTGPWR